mgnify:CR=1 FL=1
MRIRWTPRATRNVLRIGEYIRADDPIAAEKLVATIGKSVGNLADHSSMGRVGRTPGTRELIVSGTPYIVGYRVGDAEVAVIRVLHAARKWPGSP